MPNRFLQLVIIGACVLTISSCSIQHIYMRITSDYIKYKFELLKNESNLQKVQQQLPDNIESLEQLISDNREDKENRELRIYAAQAYYSYAFAFIEDRDINHATQLYFKAYQHAIKALALHGITNIDLQGDSIELREKVKSLKNDATDALYWTAISWAKLIEVNQPSLPYLIQFYKPAILMKKVLKLDDSYHYYGSYIFFAVYYAALPYILGGNDTTAISYFNMARKLNNNRLLIIDVLQLKYLNSDMQDALYTQRLQKIIDTPNDRYPEHALMNAVAKDKAANMLKLSRHE